MNSSETYGFIMFFDDGRNHYGPGTQNVPQSWTGGRRNGSPEPRLRQVEMFLRSTAAEGIVITALHGSSTLLRLYKKAQGEFTMMRGYEIVYVLILQLLCNVLYLLRILQNA
jgi:hypothetical protein